MSATYQRVFYLNVFKKNDFLLWSVCTQAYENFSVVIRDDKQTYLEVSKKAIQLNYRNWFKIVLPITAEVIYA